MDSANKKSDPWEEITFTKTFQVFETWKVSMQIYATILTRTLKSL